MSQMTDKIPELQQLAYSMYQDKLNGDRADLNTLIGLEDNNYNRWLTDRNYLYQLARDQVGDLPPEATAANFAKVADDATPSDKMLGIVNLVLQSIGTMSVLACKCCGTDTVVLTGALTMLPPARETFELFKQLYHVNFIIPENATFATAIGAALYSVREN
jgi:hypothetical protein